MYMYFHNIYLKNEYKHLYVLTCCGITFYLNEFTKYVISAKNIKNEKT